MSGRGNASGAGPVRGSVSVVFVNEALAALERAGLDAAPILAEVGVPATVLDNRHGRIGAEAFGRLWLAIAAATDDEFFGQDRRRLKVGSFATLCQLTLHCRDLREALSRGARLLNLLLDDLRVELELDGVSGMGEGAAGAAFAFVATDPAQPPPRFAHETLFVMLHGLLCWLVGRRIVIRRADFAYDAPPHAGEYPTIYSQVLCFSMPRTRFLFDAIDLAAPVVQNERAAREFLHRAPGNFVVKYKNPDSPAEHLRQRFRDAAPEHWLSFEDCAAELDLSLSTLRRRLRVEGTSYRELKDRARRDRALRQLEQTDMSVAQIATALGFAEPSAFHRAFRQWTGASPGDWRAAKRKGGDTAP